MASRREAGPRGGPGPEEYPDERPARRYERRKGGNEPLWIALGGAGVVSLVLLLVLSGSSSTESDRQEAMAAFKEVLRSCIEDSAKLGVPLVDPRREAELAERLFPGADLVAVDAEEATSSMNIGTIIELLSLCDNSTITILTLFPESFLVVGGARSPFLMLNLCSVVHSFKDLRYVQTSLEITGANMDT